MGGVLWTAALSRINHAIAEVRTTGSRSRSGRAPPPTRAHHPNEDLIRELQGEYILAK